MRPRVKVKDVVDISAGYPFRGKIDEVRGGGVKVVQMKDVSFDDGVNWAGLTESELTGKKAPDYLKTGDILFIARGARNYAIYIDQQVESVVCAPHFYLLKTKVNTLNPQFLSWLLNQSIMQAMFDSLAEGSVQKSLRRSLLENIEIVIPPMEKQLEIVKLNALAQRQKQSHRQIIANTDKMMNSIASDLMTGKTNWNTEGSKRA